MTSALLYMEFIFFAKKLTSSAY